MTTPQPPKLKIVLIGTGGWARQHARVFSARKDVEFAAICGRNSERTAARAGEFGARAYTDIGVMLDSEKPDLVSVCLPNEHHFEPTLQVIEAGYPLLAEKPLVFEMVQADRLIDEAAQRNLFFAINFNHRYARPIVKATEAIEAGKLGPLIFATARFGGYGFPGHPFANLIETQCHIFDQLEYLMGPIESVAAEMADLTGKGCSTMAIALKFASGAVGNLLGSYDSSYDYPETHRLEINGAEGRLIVRDTVKEYEFQRSGSETAERWQAGYFNDEGRGFHQTFDLYVDHLLEAFRAGDPPPVPAETGRRSLKLALAAIKSHKTGRRVAV